MKVIVNNKILENILVEEFNIRNLIGTSVLMLMVLIMPKNEMNKINQPNLEITVEDKEKRLFFGNIEEVIFEDYLEDSYIVRVQARDKTYYLQKNINHRFYQDKDMSYKELLEDVLRPYQIKHYVSKDFDKKIDGVIYQDEDDWHFLVRAASMLHKPVYVTETGVLVFGCDKINTKVEEI